jgi:hypothetical protein
MLTVLTKKNESPSLVCGSRFQRVVDPKQADDANSIMAQTIRLIIRMGNRHHSMVSVEYPCTLQTFKSYTVPLPDYDRAAEHSLMSWGTSDSHLVDTVVDWWS